MSKIHLSKYEKKQIEEIKKWGNEKPGTIQKKMNDYLGPVFTKITDVLPKSFMNSFMDILNGAGSFLADEKDICRDGKVASVTDLVDKNLETCDKLANNVQNWAKGMAGVEGAVTGAVGAVGVLADIPGLLLLALRTIHKIGFCYGFKADSETDKIQILEILCLANSATVGEKNYYLSGGTAVVEALLKPAAKATAENATKSATKSGFKAALAKQNEMMLKKSAEKAVEKSGQQIVERESSKVVPAVGALIGLAVNIKYISDVSWAAKRCFQKWWFVENGKWDNKDFETVDKKPVFEFDTMDAEFSEDE